MSFKIVSISLPPKDHSALKTRLLEVGMTRSEYVRSLLRRDLADVAPTIRITSATPTGRKLKTGKMKGGRK